MFMDVPFGRPVFEYAFRDFLTTKEEIMKKTMEIVISIVGLFLLAIPVGFTADNSFSGFLGDPARYDLLKPGPKDGARLRWLKEGVDIKKYNKFMVDSVIFYLADSSEYKGIDPQEMKELADSFNRELVAAFKDKWPIVAEPGPDVVRIRIAITNIRPSKPGVSAVTSIIPIGLGVSLVKKGATGGWSGSGETGIELMTMDSMTDEVIAMAVDRRNAEFEQRFSKWGSANDAFKFWSEKIVSFIDDAHGIKRESGK